MCLYWPLPDRLLINWTGKEWLLKLLDEAQVSVRSRIIMVLWRSWYVRNEIQHGKVPPPQDVSSSFLQSYHNTFSEISSSVEDIIKGKSPVVPDQISPPCKSAPWLSWPHPPDGMVALSVDGSYAISDGSAGAGMILRTPTGEVIFAAYRKLFHRNDALEAELQAIREGVKLATERSDATIMLQSDCAAAINALADSAMKARRCRQQEVEAEPAAEEAHMLADLDELEEEDEEPEPSHALGTGVVDISDERKLG
ncbi:protein transport protein sec24 [Hordeum vulgare]|nr:protein transport protein sec24 [Hordeum vulgare]